MIFIKEKDNSTMYSCEEHMDLAIDDFLIKYETFPIITHTKDNCCNYCNSNATYRLEITD